MVIQATALNRRKQTGDSVISMEREGKALRADRKERRKTKKIYRRTPLPLTLPHQMKTNRPGYINDTFYIHYFTHETELSDKELYRLGMVSLLFKHRIQKRVPAGQRPTSTTD